MYGKHFAKMYEGSMVGAGSHVFAVWGYCISHADPASHTVSLNPQLLAAILGESAEQVKHAITFLTQPDPDSRCKEFDGARLVQDSGFQYFVVTHEYYRNVGTMKDLHETDPSSKGGYVYFVGASRGDIKIGYSKNPWARVRDMQTSNNKELRLLGSFRGTRADETKLHQQFSDINVRGEWFKRTPELLDFIEDQANITKKSSYGSSTVVTTPVSASASDDASPSDEKKKKEPKDKYGEFQNVRLTKKEYRKLLDQHGRKLAAGIETLDDYIEHKGKRYKSHYAVLKPTGWVWDRVREKDAASGVPTDEGDRIDYDDPEQVRALLEED